MTTNGMFQGAPKLICQADTYHTYHLPPPNEYYPLVIASPYPAPVPHGVTVYICAVATISESVHLPDVTSWRDAASDTSSGHGGQRAPTRPNTPWSGIYYYYQPTNHDFPKWSTSQLYTQLDMMIMEMDGYDSIPGHDRAISIPLSSRGFRLFFDTCLSTLGHGGEYSFS